ncbi:hypothetical protein CXQ80_13345 [Pseudomonas sp. 02C 26]|uniref:hypothetical protein n=1 Tax=Pseudomonas sp. 02C 26 TaxID=2054914 RepID=UPI000C6D5B98|nr:hypothetical protein [Pseudomonas sp. 02C 26]AUF96749.1 hypothetical protein CXQ80_13345 [Pseudomonas sp. 02C 26]
MEIDWKLSRDILATLNELVPSTRQDIDSGGLYNEMKAKGLKLGHTPYFLLTIDALVKDGFIISAGAVGEEDGFPHPHHFMKGLTESGKQRLKTLYS